MAEKAAIIGRFQVPQLHAGHERLLYEVMLKVSNKGLTILLGTSRARFDPRNPLSFEARKLMLEEYVPGARILPIEDHPSDLEWSNRVDALLEPGTVIYAGRDSFAPHYFGERTVVVLPIDNSLSGTMIRNNTKVERVKNYDQRLGYINAMMNIPPMVFPTVDVGCFYNNQLVLAYKKGDHGYRFPGGFVDPSDVSLQAAAQRELREETSLYAPELEYIGSTLIEDPRYRDTPHRIITALFTAAIDDPKRYEVLTAGDDVDVLVLMDPSLLRLDDFVKEHRVLWGMFRNYFQSAGLL